MSTMKNKHELMAMCETMLGINVTGMSATDIKSLATKCAAIILQERIGNFVSLTPEIKSMMIISTGHLKAATAQMLDEDNLLRLRQKTVKDSWGQSVEYGYLVWAGWGTEEYDLDLPEEVLAACKVARDSNCEYVKYDCDGELLVALGDYIYEW